MHAFTLFGVPTPYTYNWLYSHVNPKEKAALPNHGCNTLSTDKRHYIYSQPQMQGLGCAGHATTAIRTCSEKENIKVLSTTKRSNSRVADTQHLNNITVIDWRCTFTAYRQKDVFKLDDDEGRSTFVIMYSSCERKHQRLWATTWLQLHRLFSVHVKAATCMSQKPSTLLPKRSICVNQNW